MTPPDTAAETIPHLLQLGALGVRVYSFGCAQVKIEVTDPETQARLATMRLASCGYLLVVDPSTEAAAVVTQWVASMHRVRKLPSALDAAIIIDKLHDAGFDARTATDVANALILGQPKRGIVPQGDGAHVSATQTDKQKDMPVQGTAGPLSTESVGCGAVHASATEPLDAVRDVSPHDQKPA